MRRLILGFVAFCGACEETPAPTAPVPSATPVSSDAPIVEKKDAGEPQKICMCALCQPLVSDDACKSDDDCAPSTPCHAKACIAKAKAEPRKPDTMCTQDLQCDSADSNACGCVKGRCTLHAR